MKLNSLAMALAIGLVIAGCGGGGSGPASSAPPSSAPVDAGIATFTSLRGDYSIARVDNGIAVTDLRNNSASTVRGAQVLRFTDMRITLGIAEKAIIFGAYRTKELIEMYMAFLGRVPDADSLGAWIDRMNAGQTIAQVADGLYAEALLAPAVSGYSAAMTTTEFVTAVYKNAFGRFAETAPSAAEVENWANRIGKGGISRAALVLVMLTEAHTGTSDLASPATVRLLENKIAVGDYFAVQQGLTYNAAEESVLRTKEIAAAVTSTDFLVAQGKIGFVDAAFNLRSIPK